LAGGKGVALRFRHGLAPATVDALQGQQLVDGRFQSLARLARVGVQEHLQDLVLMEVRMLDAVEPGDGLRQPISL
jgi:hypothetical protein